VDLQQFGSVGGIVAATMIAVEILKRAIGNRPWFRVVPTWVYAVVVATVLTVGSVQFGLMLDAGVWYVLVAKAIGLAATASGFWTWLREPNDQIRDSDAAIARRP
jgi:hypothetical protein